MLQYSHAIGGGQYGATYYTGGNKRQGCADAGIACPTGCPESVFAGLPGGDDLHVHVLAKFCPV